MLKFSSILYPVIITSIYISLLYAPRLRDFVESHYDWFKPLFFNCPDGPWWACWQSREIMEEICKIRDWEYQWSKTQNIFQTCHCCTNEINRMLENL